MLKTLYKLIIVILGVFSLSKPSTAITGKEISDKVSKWLLTEGVTGKPIFSNTRIYKDCKNDIQIK